MWMKAKTQADCLQNLMLQQVYPCYNLSLPPIEIKRNTLESLEAGDILLLGLDSLTLMVIDENGVSRATAELYDRHGNIKINTLQTQKEQDYTFGKYEILTLSLGSFQANKLEARHIIKTNELRFDRLDVQAGDKMVAQGSLVRVDGKFAVQIDKVEK